MRICISLLFLLILNKSFACECKVYPVINGKDPIELKLKDSFKSAQIIYYARYLGKGKFKKIKAYRDSKLIKTQDRIITKTADTMCGYSFVQDEKYLVFGMVGESGKLLTSYCDPNRLIKNRSELKFIKKYLKE